MTANGSGNRDEFQRWVASLDDDGHAPVAAPLKSLAKDAAAPLADDGATHVQQIPKEIIHRLRERESQGMLGVEQERTAVFKPPPELLARAKKAQRAAAEAAAKAPADRSEVPTAPPPPEASVPTKRPPAPAPAVSSGDGWKELFEPALAALKPIAARPVSARKSAPDTEARKSTPDTEARKSTPDSEARESRPDTEARKSTPELAPIPSQSAAPRPTPLTSAASEAPSSVPALQVAAPPASPLPESDPLDEPTLLRIVPRSMEPRAARPAEPAPLEFDAASTPELVAPPIEAFASPPEPATIERVESIAPVADGNASGRRWLVVAAVFLLVVVVALAAISH